MKSFILIILFFITLNFNLNAQETWLREDTKHFIILYQGNWKISGFNLEIERLYDILKIYLSPFSPWMLREKTTIYIYSDKENYLKGEFSPPKWSKGLAFPEKKTVVVYNIPGKQDKFLATVAHELTHLYFENYFREKLKTPPLWLNEGLAVFIEDMSYTENPPWTRALKFIDESKYIPFEKFFNIDPNSINNDGDITMWYLQAFGIVKYLYNPTMKINFFKLCRDIRKNIKFEKALWNNYRIEDLYLFEKKWHYWLKTEFKKSHDNHYEFKPFKKIKFKQFNSKYGK